MSHQQQQQANNQRRVDEAHLQSIWGFLAAAQVGARLGPDNTWEREYRRDVASLKLALEERDHLIHVMATDSEAYERGRLDEISWFRSEAERIKALAVKRWDDPYNSSPAEIALDALDCAIEERLSEMKNRDAPPLPPSEVRADRDRLWLAIQGIKDYCEGEARKILPVVDIQGQSSWATPAEQIIRLCDEALDE